MKKFVIEKNDEDRTQLRSNLAGQIKELENNLNIITGKVDALAVQITALSSQVKDILQEQKMRDIARQRQAENG